MRRVCLKSEPFLDFSGAWIERGQWPASWIDHPDRPARSSSVALFRREFTCAEPLRTMVHVSADNRYRLFLDGEPVGRGPERSDPGHWAFESYELELGAGSHVLVAQTWWMAGEEAPCSQMSVRSGFLLAAEGAGEALLSTGIAPWEAQTVTGLDFIPAVHAPWTGAKVRVSGDDYTWGWERGEGAGWTGAEVIAPGMSAAWKNERSPWWLLSPASLPPMKEERFRAGIIRHLADGDMPDPVSSADHLPEEGAVWQKLMDGAGGLTIPPHTSRRAVIDLDNYYCAYPELVVSGGAGSTICVLWAEALADSLERSTHGYSKGNRDQVEGKYFLGVGDEFRPDGGSGRLFTTLWWETGRFLEVTITTADEALTIDSFSFIETGYPYEVEHRFTASDPRLEGVVPIMFRGLEMCSHETYMDCPYYEQLMYVGDTRLECLVTHVLTSDDRLPRKALSLFGQSRLNNGFTQSRYPSRILQVIPPFSLWYVCMAQDYSMWRDDPEFVRGLLPGIRSILEGFRATLGEDGLLRAPNGWNFVDWVPAWGMWGMPPGADLGVSSIVNLQFVLALQAKAGLEEAFGEAALAERDRATARRAFDAIMDRFFSPERGMVADDEERVSFSEHAQCLAILTGLLPADKQTAMGAALLDADDLHRTTVYFTHYLFEAMRVLRRPDRIMERLELWFGFEAQGFKTTPEMPEPSRSDCHAWAAHPIFHYTATLLGVRPAAPGFRRVRIEPMLGTLEWAEAVIPHPDGLMKVSARREADFWTVTISLPPGVTGVVGWSGMEHDIPEGESVLKLTAVPEAVIV